MSKERWKEDEKGRRGRSREGDGEKTRTRKSEEEEPKPKVLFHERDIPILALSSIFTGMLILNTPNIEILCHDIQPFFNSTCMLL
jgi:hypothetical protein